MNKDTKVFLVSPTYHINSLCADFFDAENFHEGLKIVNEKTNFTMKGWEMTLDEARIVKENASAAGLKSEPFLIAAYRRDGCTLRLLKKDEWIPAEQHKRSLARKIARAITSPIKTIRTILA